MKVKTLFGRRLLCRIIKTPSFVGSIQVPVKETLEAQIVQVGDGWERNYFVPGERILYEYYTKGFRIEQEKKEYILLEESDIVGKVLKNAN